MDPEYSQQAINEARKVFDRKVRRAMTTAIYGSMADFYTSDELDDLMYESTEKTKLLLEAEGADVDVEAEIEAEDAIADAMQTIHRRSEVLRHDEPVCPHCHGDLLSDPEDGADVEVLDDLEAWMGAFLNLGE